MHPVGHARRNVHEIVRRDLDPIPVQYHHSAARNREDEKSGLVLRRDGDGGPWLHDRMLEAQAVQHAREIENGVATQLVCGAGQLREAAIGVARHYSPPCRRGSLTRRALRRPKNGHAGPPVQGIGRQASLLASFTGFVAMLSARRLFGAVCCAVLPIKIGRASCRERVEMWVRGVYLWKK